jgi:uncharacterized protein (DUF433 family)
MKHFITTNPKIMGGLPCITGTRIPVAQILFLLKQGYSLKEIQEDYSWVSLATLEGVMQELAQQLGSTSYDAQTVQT